jgi:hypothetical protein
MPTIGNWNIAGINIPDFHISESIGLGGHYGTATSNMTPVSGGGGGSWGPSETTNTSGSNTNYTNLYNNVTPPAVNGITDLADEARRKEEERAAREAAERKRRLKEARSAYNPFFEELLRQEAQIPTIKNDYMNFMNQGYGNQVASVYRGQEAGLSQANASAGVVKQNQATSLRDLASNLSSAVNAFGQRLGQAGAGDSSAANTANFAYSKLANRNTADVMSQVRRQLGEIETAKQNIVKDAQDKLGALETWKAEQTLSIQQYVRSLQDYISQARASGKTAMAQNEVDAIREGFTRSMERLQQINDFEITSKAAILQNSQAALADANAFSQNLTQMGTINPEAINQAPIDSGTIDNGGSAVLPIPLGITEEKDKSLADLLYGTTISSGMSPSTGY